MRHVCITRPLAILAVLGLLDGCTGVMAPAGPVGAAERTILLNSLAIMLAIVIPDHTGHGHVCLVVPRLELACPLSPDWAYSGRMELIVWSIPALVVFFLGGIAWIGSHDLDPARPCPPECRAAGGRRGVARLEVALHLPAPGRRQYQSAGRPGGVPLHLRITSATVLNVFFVPRLGSEIYAMNGMASQLNLRPTQPGVYPGLSAHFSGDGFSDMRFEVHAVPLAGLHRLGRSGAQANGPELDSAAYRALLRQTRTSSRTPIAACRPDCSKPSCRRSCRQATGRTAAGRMPRSRRRRRIDVFGKLTWQAIPFDQPIPLASSAAWWPSCCSGSCCGCW